MWKKFIMRICIPTEDAHGSDSKVYGHFGSAPYFTIYDEKYDSYEVISNMDNSHNHGACNPVRAISGKKIDGVVCRGMGARALQKLLSAGIKAYISYAVIVRDVILNLKSNSLTEMTLDNSCKEHGCH